MTAEKGAALTPREAAILDERIRAVTRWLETYAPDSARYTVVEDLPAEVARLGDDQRVFLGALTLRAEEQGVPARAWSGRARSSPPPRTAGCSAGRAFGALYVAFLGRTNGPRAGWLLASLEPEVVLRRLREAAGWRAAEAVSAGAGGPGGDR